MNMSFVQVGILYLFFRWAVNMSLVQVGIPYLVFRWAVNMSLVQGILDLRMLQRL